MPPLRSETILGKIHQIYAGWPEFNQSTRRKEVKKLRKMVRELFISQVQYLKKQDPFYAGNIVRWLRSISKHDLERIGNMEMDYPPPGTIYSDYREQIKHPILGLLGKVYSHYPVKDLEMQIIFNKNWKCDQFSFKRLNSEEKKTINASVRYRNFLIDIGLFKKHHPRMKSTVSAQEKAVISALETRSAIKQHQLFDNSNAAKLLLAYSGL